MAVADWRASIQASPALRVFEKSWFRQSGEHESNRDEID
jgi:hypothetical protein